MPGRVGREGRGRDGHARRADVHGQARSLAVPGRYVVARSTRAGSGGQVLLTYLLLIILTILKDMDTKGYEKLPLWDEFLHISIIFHFLK